MTACPARGFHRYGVAAVVCALVLAVAPVAMAVPAEPSPQPGPTPGQPERGPTRPEPGPGPTPAPQPPKKTPDAPPNTEGGGSEGREPSPGPTPPACEVDGRKCTPTNPVGDYLDIPAMVTDAITGFLGMVVDQLMKPLRKLLAATYLTTPDVTEHADLRRLWKASMATAISLYVLFVMAGGLTVMGYETVQTRYAVKQIAPRLVVGLVAAASSLTVMGKAIALANSLSAAVMGSDLSDAGQGLIERALPFLAFGVKGLAVYLILLAIVATILMLGVLIGYIVRVAFMAVLAVAAPLALACHAHPVTDPVARMWWRALGACLSIQVAQSLTFIVALKLFFAPGSTLLGLSKPNQLGTTLAGIALFWALFKIPGWCMQIIFRSTVLSAPHSPAPLRMLRNVATMMLLRRFVPALGNARRAGAAGGGRRPGAGGVAGGGRGPTPGTGGGPGQRPTGTSGAGGGPGGAGGGPAAGRGSGSGTGPGTGTPGAGASPGPTVTYSWGQPGPTPAPGAAASDGSARSGRGAGRTGSGVPGGRAVRVSSPARSGPGGTAAAPSRGSPSAPGGPGSLPAEPGAPATSGRPVAGARRTPSARPSPATAPAPRLQAPRPGRDGPVVPTPRPLPRVPPRAALPPGRPLRLQLPLEPPRSNPT